MAQQFIPFSKYRFIIFVVAATGIIFYLSWTPDPNIGNLITLPVWLSRWINNYGNLRTAVPFLFFAFLFEIFLKWNSFKNRIYYTAGCFIIVSIAEIGQLSIPKRNFDLMDVTFAISGTVVGIILGAFVKTFYQLSTKKPK